MANTLDRQRDHRDGNGPPVAVHKEPGLAGEACFWLFGRPFRSSVLQCARTDNGVGGFSSITMAQSLCSLAALTHLSLDSLFRDLGAARSYAHTDSGVDHTAAEALASSLSSLKDLQYLSMNSLPFFKGAADTAQPCRKLYQRGRHQGPCHIAEARDASKDTRPRAFLHCGATGAVTRACEQTTRSGTTGSSIWRLC